MDAKAKIRDYFATRKEDIRQKIINRLSALVAIKSINAGKERLQDFPWMKVPGEETKVVRELARIFQEVGAAYAEYAMIPERSNIIARWGEGKGPSLLVACHTDVVPAGEGWSIADPFKMEVKGDLAYGRGTLDNKGPMVSSIAAMEALIDLGIHLKGTFIFAGVASEEFREPDEKDPGIEYLFENGILKTDMAIIPDIGEFMKLIDVAEKGRMVVNITAIGKQAHGSTPELGINAIHQMARLLTRLEEMKMDFEVHPVLGEPTVNLGIIRGGNAANIVPGMCTSVLDIRFVPSQTPEGILSEIKALAKEVGGEWNIEIETSTPPHAVGEEGQPLITAIQKNSKEILGFEPQTFGMGGGTFAKTFNLHGVPAVGFGPGDPDAFHVTDEYISISELLQFAELLACIAVDLLGEE